MPTFRIHYCEKYPDGPDEVHVPQGERCEYCGWLAVRPIIPHKGGRTMQMNFRISPETAGKLEAILGELQISLADWIEANVNSAANGRKGGRKAKAE